MKDLATHKIIFVSLLGSVLFYAAASCVRVPEEARPAHYMVKCYSGGVLIFEHTANRADFSNAGYRNNSVYAFTDVGRFDINADCIIGPIP